MAPKLDPASLPGNRWRTERIPRVLGDVGDGTNGDDVDDDRKPRKPPATFPFELEVGTVVRVPGDHEGTIRPGPKTPNMHEPEEVKRQFKEIPGLLQGTPGHAPADHDRCIKISTDASLREMVPPGLLVSPIITKAPCSS